MLHQCDFFSQLTAFRKRFEGLQPEAIDLSHLPFQEAGGQMKGSEFHGTKHHVWGGSHGCLPGRKPLPRATGGGMATGPSAPQKAAAAPGQ